MLRVLVGMMLFAVAVVLVLVRDGARFAITHEPHSVIKCTSFVYSLRRISFPRGFGGTRPTWRPETSTFFYHIQHTHVYLSEWQKEKEKDVKVEKKASGKAEESSQRSVEPELSHVYCICRGSQNKRRSWTRRCETAPQVR